jgi:hypothetical protein
MKRSAPVLLATLALLSVLTAGCDVQARREARAVRGKKGLAVQVKTKGPAPEVPQVAPKPAPPVVAVKPREDVGPAWEINGWGRDLPEAEEYALNGACEKIEAYLQRQVPPLKWVPSLKYIREHFVQGPAQRHEDQDKEVAAGPDKYLVKCWSLTVAITPTEMQKLVRQDQLHQAEQRRKARESVMEDRMFLLVRLLAAVLAVLLAVAGYLRLDEWTKGYYTGRLKFAVMCGLGATAVLLWLFS